MKVQIFILDYGFEALVTDGGKTLGTILGVTMANLCQSVYEVYGINMFELVSLN